MHCRSSSRLPKDGHVVWVSSKVQDIVPHPLQGQNHVLHGVVSGSESIASAQESQDSQAIVQGHKDNIFRHIEIRREVARVSTAPIEASSVDPDHHRSAPNDIGRVDVQE